ncbi:MAG: hypothetical protein OXI54_07915 [Chloroflexota bacterium]|nr:hypothetical protein [Chloroflexota bacterium]MDE2684060.1 hypothetical protein [Chloroflexota bacterium]
MEAKRQSLTLVLDPPVRRRLKAIAAFKGVSMERYCLTAIGNEMDKDEANDVSGRGFDRDAFERIVARREELFSGQPLSGNSVDLLRDARDIRGAETEKWL